MPWFWTWVGAGHIIHPPDPKYCMQVILNKNAFQLDAYCPLFTVQGEGSLCPGRGVSVQGGGLCSVGLCPGGSLSWLVSVQGVSVQGGSLSGGLYSRGSVHGGFCQGDPLPPVNRMTHRCKNIALPQTSFAGFKNCLIVSTGHYNRVSQINTYQVKQSCQLFRQTMSTVPPCLLVSNWRISAVTFCCIRKDKIYLK